MSAYGEIYLKDNFYLVIFSATNTPNIFNNLDDCIIYSELPNDWEIELDNKYVIPITPEAIYLSNGRNYKLISGTGNLFLYVVRGH